MGNPLAKWPHDHCTKLTEDQVRAIFFDPRKPYRLIAADYGIDPAHVCNIKLRRNWKNLRMGEKHLDGAGQHLVDTHVGITDNSHVNHHSEPHFHAPTQSDRTLPEAHASDAASPHDEA